MGEDNMPQSGVESCLSSCIEETDRPIFALQDRGTGRHATVRVESRKCQKIRVDGCLCDIATSKCDWCIRDSTTGECLFVELKGNDCSHAAEQIINTIRWFRQKINPFIPHKYAYIIAKSGIPKLHSKKQIAMARLAKQESILLRCGHSGIELPF